ncbi:trypsin-like serine peptidase [Streptomyces sp. NPDC059740]|uniref:trypsin-like serine peptidase n=1 Tax=Streptomyces sp. NPDC059740 TaxID=3346926 RepID=UPI003656C936
MRSMSRQVCAAVALTAALAMGTTACGPEDDNAGGQPSESATAATTGGSGAGGFTIPKGLQDKLKQHGIDLDKWKNGEWKNWDKDQWMREAGEFLNPIIKGLWDPDRAGKAKPEQPSTPAQPPADQGQTDPEPAPVRATAITAPYSQSAPGLGRLLFDTPEGQAACSAAVVKDPAHPGKSNLVWTAGHCVHAGKSGGWYRNMIFAPSFNDAGKLTEDQVNSAPRDQVFPKGVWWADDAATTNQWISDGGEQNNGVPMAPYDFAIIHVKPEKGTTKSLEEVAGGAYDIDFNTPSMSSVGDITAQGYPAAAPFDGSKAEQCVDGPGRLTLDQNDPTMYRIGCTMTPGSSGGPWFETKGGVKKIVSNTSIGPSPSTWLAGPHLGAQAQKMYQTMSKAHAAG